MLSSYTVAVAGGLGELGRGITEAIVAAGKYEVVILSRKKEKEIGAPIISVDCTDVEALTEVSEDYKIHTVISTLPLLSTAQHELNLLAAADKSSTTKRYVPSTWVIDFEDGLIPNLPAYPPSSKEKAEVLRSLRSTHLEFTSWNIGFFADYYVAPHVKSNLLLMSIVVDMENDTAAIPGSGNVPLPLTYSQDVGDLVGDKVTWKELVALAEDVKGVKFNVMYDSADLMKQGLVAELPSHKAICPFLPKELLHGAMDAYGVIFDTGAFEVKSEQTIDQDFPGIKLHSLKEILAEAWAGK